MVVHLPPSSFGGIALGTVPCLGVVAASWTEDDAPVNAIFVCCTQNLVCAVTCFGNSVSTAQRQAPRNTSARGVQVYSQQAPVGDGIRFEQAPP
eukprot:COSAG02_NODE_10301_length_1974_cov_7.726483_1_plen_94_part_00